MQCDNVFVIDMILISKHLMFFKELFNKTEGRKKTTKTNRAANPQVLYECYIQIVCNLWELLAEMLGLYFVDCIKVNTSNDKMGRRMR